MKLINLLKENKNPEFDRLVNSFIKRIADKYDYSMQDAVYGVLQVLKRHNYDGLNENNPCWDGYEQYGMKEKDGKQVPNCVKK